MAGKHRRSESSGDEKPCRWCNGMRGYDAWDAKGKPRWIRCGRCGGTGTR